MARRLQFGRRRRHGERRTRGVSPGPRGQFATRPTQNDDLLQKQCAAFP
jgi:hypothetical protein